MKWVILVAAATLPVIGLAFYLAILKLAGTLWDSSDHRSER